MGTSKDNHISTCNLDKNANLLSYMLPLYNLQLNDT